MGCSASWDHTLRPRRPRLICRPTRGMDREGGMWPAGSHDRALCQGFDGLDPAFAAAICRAYITGSMISVSTPQSDSAGRAIIPP